MLRGLPLGGGGIAHLATRLPFGEVIPREHLLPLETGTPALVRAIRRQLITLAVDRGRLETVGVATSAIEVLELRQLTDYLQADRGAERNAQALLLLALFGGDQDHAVVGARAIEGGGTGSFQYGEAFYIIGVNVLHQVSVVVTAGAVGRPLLVEI